MSNLIEIDDAVVLLLGAGVADGRTARIRGITRLEKLIFLLERETRSKSWLTEDAQFEPYNFGPFSRKVYDAVETLAAADIITDSAQFARDDMDTWEAREVIGESPEGGNPYTSRDFALTDRGWKYFNALRNELKERDYDELVQFKAQFGVLPLRQLIRYVYSKYQNFTTKSLIRDQVMGGS
jgi:uncharacterized protein YwgA